jgi:MOSC domain-containing protein YiiM
MEVSMDETGRVHELLLWPEKGCPEPTALEKAEAVPGLGLRGDQTRGQSRQVTLLAAEAWEAATAELGVSAPPSARRANVVIRGLDLAGTLGKRLRVGPVLIHVHGETDPCELMDRVTPGLKVALTPQRRAGVFGAVIEGGVISVGDTVAVE